MWVGGDGVVSGREVPKTKPAQSGSRVSACTNIPLFVFERIPVLTCLDLTAA